MPDCRSIEPIWRLVTRLLGLGLSGRGLASSSHVRAAKHRCIFGSMRPRYNFTARPVVVTLTRMANILKAYAETQARET